MSLSQPASYSRAQIFLHWAIALLVFFQLIFGEAIGEYGHALRDGTTPDSGLVIMGNAHIWVGVTILVLMLARIALRLSHGAPALIPGPKLQETVAKAIHGLFYLLLIAAPLTGLAAWFLKIRPAGEVHELMKPVFIVLIVLHIVGALWHKFVLKDATMQRMVSSKA
jgi:cytochrome b561